MRPGEFRTETFPPPIKGWVEESAAANTPKDSAVVLDNFFPTLEGARLRHGAERVAWSGSSTTILRAAVPRKATAIRSVGLAGGSPTDPPPPGTRIVLYDSGNNKVANSEATFQDILPAQGGELAQMILTDIASEAVWNNIFYTAGISRASGGDGSYIARFANLSLHDLTDATIPAVTQTDYTTGRPIESLISRNIAIPALFAAVAESSPNAADGYIAAASGDLTAQKAVSGLRGANWSTTHISTAGGDFLVGVNGIDHGFVSDAQSWSRYNYGSDVDGSRRMHGEATSKFSQVWNFKERLFFVEKGTMNAWYLAAKALADTDSARIAKLPLGALFEKGGALLFGATYSMDGGDGPDDYCVFATDQGEVAVFGGIDPGNASGSNPWRLEGRFEVAPPLNANAHFQLGGDLAILTADGIVSLTEVSRSDRVAASNAALTRPVGDAWRRAVKGTGYPVSAALWRETGLLLVGMPPDDGRDTSFAMNAETGAWCRFTGWDVRCTAVSAGKLFFGTSDGRVMEAEAGGSDDGSRYLGLWVPKFRDFKDRRRKFANRACLDFNAVEGAAYAIRALADFKVAEPPIPEPLIADAGSRLVWGSSTWSGSGAVWGGSTAGEQNAVNRLEWRGTRAIGRSLSVAVQVQANTQDPPHFEILLAQVRFEGASEF